MSGSASVTYELHTSCNHLDNVGRNGLVYADRHFTPYQLEELKPLAGSVLQNQQAELRDAKDVTSLLRLCEQRRQPMSIFMNYSLVEHKTNLALLLNE